MLAQAAAAFGLLASPARLHIVWALAQGESDVTGLAERVGGALPAVSQHLTKLKLAGLVRSRREGRRQVYSVDDPDVAEVVRLLVDRRVAASMASETAEGTTLDVLRRLESGPRGLTEPEAASRLAAYGENTLPDRRTPVLAPPVRACPERSRHRRTALPRPGVRRRRLLGHRRAQRTGALASADRGDRPVRLGEAAGRGTIAGPLDADPQERGQGP